MNVYESLFAASIAIPTVMVLGVGFALHFARVPYTRWQSLRYGLTVPEDAEELDSLGREVVAPLRNAAFALAAGVVLAFAVGPLLTSMEGIASSYLSIFMPFALAGIVFVATVLWRERRYMHITTERRSVRPPTAVLPRWKLLALIVAIVSAVSPAVVLSIVGVLPAIELDSAGVWTDGQVAAVYRPLYVLPLLLGALALTLWFARLRGAASEENRQRWIETERAEAISALIGSSLLALGFSLGMALFALYTLREPLAYAEDTQKAEYVWGMALSIAPVVLAPLGSLVISLPAEKRPGRGWFGGRRSASKNEQFEA